MKKGKYSDSFKTSDLHEWNISMSRFMEIVTKYSFKITPDINIDLLYSDTVSLLRQSAQPLIEFGKMQQVSIEEANEETQLEKDTSNSIFEANIIAAVNELLKREGIEKYLNKEKTKKAKMQRQRYLREKRIAENDDMNQREVNYLRQLDEMRIATYYACQAEARMKINLYYNQINMINAKIDDLLDQKNKIFDNYGIELSDVLDKLKDSSGNSFFKGLSKEAKNAYSIEASKQIYEIERSYGKKKEQLLQAKNDIQQQLQGLKKEQHVENSFSNAKSEFVTLAYDEKRNVRIPLSEQAKLKGALSNYDAQLSVLEIEERKEKVEAIRVLSQNASLAADEIMSGIIVDGIENSDPYSKIKKNAQPLDDVVDVFLEQKKEILADFKDIVGSSKKEAIEYGMDLPEANDYFSFLEEAESYIDQQEEGLSLDKPSNPKYEI